MMKHHLDTGSPFSTKLNMKNAYKVYVKFALHLAAHRRFKRPSPLPLQFQPPFVCVVQQQA